MKRLALLLLRLPNAVFAQSPGWASRPFVYDEIAPISAELARLEASFPVIKAEYRAIRNRLKRVPRYHELDGLQHDLSASPSPLQNWRVFFLRAMGRQATRNQQLCPKTAALVDGIPNVFQAFFSVLEGGKSLAPHQSPYWGYLRYHLAIEVPKAEPVARMRVGARWVSWKEGKGILFDDSWEHEIINENPQLRSVLIIDIARPMAGLSSLINRMCTLVMRHTYALWVLRRPSV